MQSRMDAAHSRLLASRSGRNPVNARPPSSGRPCTPMTSRQAVLDHQCPTPMPFLFAEVCAPESDGNHLPVVRSQLRIFDDHPGHFRPTAGSPPMHWRGRCFRRTCVHRRLRTPSKLHLLLDLPRPRSASRRTNPVPRCGQRRLPGAASVRHADPWRVRRGLSVDPRTRCGYLGARHRDGAAPARAVEAKEKTCGSLRSMFYKVGRPTASTSLQIDGGRRFGKLARIPDHALPSFGVRRGPIQTRQSTMIKPPTRTWRRSASGAQPTHRPARLRQASPAERHGGIARCAPLPELPPRPRRQDRRTFCNDQRSLRHDVR